MTATLADRVNAAGNDLRALVRVFFPEMTDEQCGHVMWNHTSYPFGSPGGHGIEAARAYYASSLYRLRQTWDAGRVPCDGCGRPASNGDWLCRGCRRAMR